VAPAPDSETIRRLQALGYVGSFAPVTSTPGDDPKDHIKDYRAYRDLLNSGLGALERGRPAAAVPLLQKLVKLNVRGFEAHLYLGNAYAATGKLESALGEYEVALQLNPDVTMPRFEIAKIYTEQGDTPRAIAAAKQGLEREPRSFYGWYTLGVVHLRAKQFGDAFRAFSEAVQINSRDGRAAANLADAAMRTGHTDVARQQFERMIELGHRRAPAHYNLGLLAQRAGDVAAARQHFQSALKADPSFAPAKDALSKLK
jgi:tetratricopeptide (TPR) repeat protein